eukprot:scaffold55221_cov28-Tisochrysis_lutea.AAC.3
MRARHVAILLCKRLVRLTKPTTPLLQLRMLHLQIFLWSLKRRACTATHCSSICLPAAAQAHESLPAHLELWHSSDIRARHSSQRAYSIHRPRRGRYLTRGPATMQRIRGAIEPVCPEVIPPRPVMS